MTKEKIFICKTRFDHDVVNRISLSADECDARNVSISSTTWRPTWRNFCLFTTFAITCGYSHTISFILEDNKILNKRVTFKPWSDTIVYISPRYIEESSINNLLSLMENKIDTMSTMDVYSNKLYLGIGWYS